MQAREIRPEGRRADKELIAAEGGASDGFNDGYRRERDSLSKSRERHEKAGNYGSNNDLSLSSQSKTLQTQKRRWTDEQKKNPS